MTVPYRYFQSEVFRLLEVVGLVGAAPVTLEPRLSSTAAEEREADRALEVAGDAAARPLVVIHPGAGDGRRRWPAENFGHVARELASRGARVAVTGSAEDRPLAARVVAASGGTASDLAARVTLNGLAGVLRRASLVVANDSGPLHLARPSGRPRWGSSGVAI